jgi:hypothetical protein
MPNFAYANSTDPRGPSVVLYYSNPVITWTTGATMTWTTGDPITWIGVVTALPELDNTASIPTVSYKGEA